MPLQIKNFTLGQMGNNTIVLYDSDSRKAFIVDPSFQSQPVLDFVNQQALTVEKVICTHAHFDHFAGVAFFVECLSPKPAIAINALDLALWRDGGGSKQFNFRIKLPPEPDEFLSHGQILKLGDESIEIREVPGHSPGSIVLYIPSLKTVICGDTIFNGGIGRTDLVDGDHDLLINGINNQILSLPGDTLLIPGHGEVTTVSQEKQSNPFLQ